MLYGNGNRVGTWLGHVLRHDLNVKVVQPTTRNYRGLSQLEEGEEYKYYIYFMHFINLSGYLAASV